MRALITNELSVIDLQVAGKLPTVAALAGTFATTVRPFALSLVRVTFITGTYCCFSSAAAAAAASALAPYGRRLRVRRRRRTGLLLSVERSGEETHLALSEFLPISQSAARRPLKVTTCRLESGASTR